MSIYTLWHKNVAKNSEFWDHLAKKQKKIEAENMDALYFWLSAITSLLNNTVILTFQWNWFSKN